MEQLYYTQCPAGYGLGRSNGAQIKRKSAGYPASADLLHLGMKPFLTGTTKMAPPTLRYRRKGETAEVAWLSPREKEYETEQGLWGRPGGCFAHALRLSAEELAALGNWPAGLFGHSLWKRADTEQTRGRPPDAIDWGMETSRLRPLFDEIAPTASVLGLHLDQLGRLLTALAGAVREGRTLFLIDRPERLGDLMRLLTFAFPAPLRSSLTFSTYHDRPEELAGFRLSGTTMTGKMGREVLASLGYVADLTTPGSEPTVKPARWSIVLACWLIRHRPEDALAWKLANDRACASWTSESGWSDEVLDLLMGLPPQIPSIRRDAAEAKQGAPAKLGPSPKLKMLFDRIGMDFIEPALRRVEGASRNQLKDDDWYRDEVVNRSWSAVPLLLRLIGRRRARWDEFIQTLRAHVFTIKGESVSLRLDWKEAIRAIFDGGPPESATPSRAGVEQAVQPSTIDDTRRESESIARKVESASKQKDVSTVAVGIDLGTTYSVVAYLDRQGRPTSVINSSGELLTPSVVLFEDDEIVVGREAVAASAMEPGRVAECVKRDMGCKVFSKPINGEMLPPEVISSLILRKLKEDAELKIGPIKQAVITVPAYFDEPRRNATADAGRLAGFEVLDIINEPTAAALAFGSQLGMFDDQGIIKSERPLTMLVYDLGGGTFDVTIVRIEGRHFRALATDGDVRLGGKDWDEVLVNLAAERFREKHREDPRSNPQSLQELFLDAERCKKTLSERSKASITLNHLGMRHKEEITREEFEEATVALLGRTRMTTEIVVLQAGLTYEQLDKVLLVGGATRMPAVPRMLRELTGLVPDQTVSADEAVAHGAALYADLLLKRRGRLKGESKFSITNVNSHSLGLVAIDSRSKRRANEVLIPKNTPLPHTATRRFRTLKTRQKNVAVRVLEGESELPDSCTQVGDCIIRDLPSDLPAGWPVDVRVFL